MYVTTFFDRCTLTGGCLTVVPLPLQLDRCNLSVEAWPFDLRAVFTYIAVLSFSRPFVLGL